MQARIMGVLCAAWIEYGRRKYSSHLTGPFQAAFFARCFGGAERRRIALVSPKVTKRVFFEDVVSVLSMCGLGAKIPLLPQRMPLVGGVNLNGERFVEYSVVDPVPAACASLLAFEDLDSLRELSQGPFFAMPVDRALVDVPGKQIARLYDEQDEQSAPVLIDKFPSRYFRPRDPLASVRSFAAHAVEQRQLRPEKIPIVRVPLRDLLDDGQVRFPQCFSRVIVRCHDDDPIWPRLCEYFRRRPERAAEFDAVQRAAVEHGDERYIMRVSHTYEDGDEAAVAAAAVAEVRADLEKEDGVRTFMLPIALCRDGVSVSPVDGRSTVPVMCAPQCGAVTKWWSPALVVPLACGAKLTELAREDPVMNYNARRLAHAELRTIIQRIARALQAVIEGRPTVRIEHDDGNPEVFIPIPYLASLIVDQPEEALLASKRTSWCTTCAESSPVAGMFSLLKHPLPRWTNPGPALQRWDSVGEYVDVLEGKIAEKLGDLAQHIARREGDPVRDYAYFMKPVMPLEAFADLISVFPDGDRRVGRARWINVMLREPNKHHDARQLFTGDPMHLLNLAIKHTLEELAFLLDRRHLRPEYAHNWSLSCPKLATTFGCGGSHMGSFLEVPPQHNEPRRYSLLLRATLVASRVHNPVINRFVESVMIPLAQAIMIFFSPHDRVLGPVSSPLTWLGGTQAAMEFAAAELPFYQDRCAALNATPNDARFLSHHNLIHAYAALRRKGSSVITHMGLYEKLHRDARAAAQAAERAYLDCNGRAQTTQTRSLWYLHMTHRLAADSVFAPKRLLAFHRTGWMVDKETAECSEAQNAIVNAAVQLLLRARGHLVADDGSEVHVDSWDDKHILFATSCWAAVHGYAVQLAGYEPGKPPPAVPFLLAVESVRLPRDAARMRDEEDDEGEEGGRKGGAHMRRHIDIDVEGEEGEEGEEARKQRRREVEDEDQEQVEGDEEYNSLSLDGVFLFGAAARIDVGGDRNVTILLGHSPSTRPRVIGQTIVNFFTPRGGLEYDAACFLADTGGVLGAIWTPHEHGRFLISTFSVVHPALVAPKDSWYR
jgi:hypothetical protein